MAATFSVVYICNRALQMLGASAITSIEEPTKNGRECKRCYDTVRQSLLRSHVWSFATKFASLPAVVAPEDAPPVGSLWANAFTYQLPADYLRLVAVSTGPSGYWVWDTQGFDAGVDYLVQDDAIVAWTPAPLNIRYVVDFENVQRMDAIFREALAAAMAEAMCEMLTQSNPKRAANMSFLTVAISEARRINAIEKPPQRPQDDEWIRVRG